jgi:hypothetical protein
MQLACAKKGTSRLMGYAKQPRMLMEYMHTP